MNDKKRKIEIITLEFPEKTMEKERSEERIQPKKRSSLNKMPANLISKVRPKCGEIWQEGSFSPLSSRLSLKSNVSEKSFEKETAQLEQYERSLNSYIESVESVEIEHFETCKCAHNRVEHNLLI